MSFRLSSSARQFGDRVRRWLAEELDPAWQQRYQPSTPEWIEFQRDWDRALYRAGWGAIFWPSEFGGLDATAEERVVFAKVMAEAGAPEGLGKLAKRLLAPVLIHHGDAAQRERYLPPILRGEMVWAQGFSEPEAGSDLASLRTTGTVDGDQLVLSGHKIWTSHAWYCDAIFALVRTARLQRKQAGISFVLVPADAPGVSISKIQQIDGRAELSEVFFDDVRIPIGNVVGALGDGWRIAKTLLRYERGAEMAFVRSAEIRHSVRELTADLSASRVNIDDRVRQGLGRLEAAYLAAELNSLRLLGSQADGDPPGDLSAVVKLQQSEEWRRGTVDGLHLLGGGALSRGHRHFGRYFHARPATIASGSSEIQREIIAHRLLGLPAGTRAGTT
ncbi:acyl-CoA dehydrogenase family protein [Amycolatopsis pithecellobii]|uniref:Acyl-CoA dehydrogenase n=1 Tax=Amycolatopsis pithecellobii TaxID=664692 RepID=A0A6N7YJV9_9PSEU|nr:acyl-CoA dehydrogenase family protein [Amycolatopsis pithecellobii]MTD53177.1 acyl-CoA dehydrogenase [Amycolatopsis pithecellobii]